MILEDEVFLSFELKESLVCAMEDLEAFDRGGSSIACV